MRTDSIVDAHRKTTRARTSSVIFVRVSTTSTPVAREPSGVVRTRDTTAYGRSVISPVAPAAARVVAVLEMRECSSAGPGARAALSPREMMTRRSV
jgi:hypothetical protein